MNIEQLERVQQEWAQPALSGLVRDCERRYLRAARLLQVRSDEISRLQRASSEGGSELSSLLPFWSALCARYRKVEFDAQASLFQEHDAEVRDHWGRFVYREMWPALCREDECVRNVLRAIGLLHSRSRAAAAAALVRFVEDMALPLEPSPVDETDGD